MKTHLLFFFLSPYPGSKNDICVLLPAELWMGNCMKMVNIIRLSIWLKPTHRASGGESQVPLTQPFEFSRISGLDCFVTSCFVMIRFFLFIYPSHVGTHRSMSPRSMLPAYVILFAALMGHNPTRAVILCRVCDGLTFCDFVPTSFSEDKCIWAYIQSSDIQHKEKHSSVCYKPNPRCLPCGLGGRQGK